MRKINFTKMVASGNDFVVMEIGHRSQVLGLRALAKKICDRKFGVGADGLLVLSRSKVADVRMRIFNADGSEAEMCGNGARCVALYSGSKLVVQSSKVKIETKAGIIESEMRGNNVKIKLTDPRNIRLNIPIKINNRSIKVNFIDTGVPHSVVFVEGLDKIDVFSLGRQIRYHREFKPAGTNVDFIEVLNSSSIKIRTYERGVEDETLACGTGSAASAIILSHKATKSQSHRKVDVYTKSGDILKVYFQSASGIYKDVWLEGKVKVVYKGVTMIM